MRWVDGVMQCGCRKASMWRVAGRSKRWLIGGVVGRWVWVTGRLKGWGGVGKGLRMWGWGMGMCGGGECEEW